MTINEAAQLVANKTHSIYDDCKDYDLLKKVLKKAFPLDNGTDSFNFNNDADDDFYGYCRHNKGNWANIGTYLTFLQDISLSEINEDEKEKVTLVLKETIVTNDELAFERIVNETLQQIRETLIVKGKEYRRNNNPFHNFEVGARKKSISREKVLDGMLLKHEISIEDMTNDLDNGKLPSENSVNEKFGDNLIYLLLKKAMFIDRILKSKEIQL
jgi:hypothetical protein